MQRLKLFLAKKKVKLFLAPGDEGVSTVRRALKMGASVIKEGNLDTPDFGTFPSTQLFAVIRSSSSSGHEERRSRKNN